MEFDRNEAKHRRELREAEERKERLRKELQRLEQKKRTVKQRLLSSTKHETWHRMRLAYHDRLAGYAGEMASARFYLRELPARQYLEAIAPLARQMEGNSLIFIEVAAVRANLEEWTARGEALLLDRARQKYEEDCASFASWQAANPGKDDWRRKPATKAQWFLITRVAEALDLSVPKRLNCGEAFDWLQKHGGNQRLRRTDDSSSGEAA